MEENAPQQVPADAVLNELVQRGIVSQATVQLVADRIAMQVAYQNLAEQHSDHKSEKGD